MSIIFDSIRMIIGVLFFLTMILFSLNKLFFNINFKFSASLIAKTSVLTTLSMILYVVPYLKFSVPFFPAFLELHFDEIPALIAGFAYGPISGLLVIFIKTLVKLPFTTSLGIGELTDFIYGVVLVLFSSLIYSKNKKFKTAIIGLSIGYLTQTIVAIFFSTFVVLNFYMNIMGISYETILKMCQSINPKVSSLSWPFLFFIALPFNLLKGGIVFALTLLLYKKTRFILDKIHIK